MRKRLPMSQSMHVRGIKPLYLRLASPKAATIRQAVEGNFKCIMIIFFTKLNLLHAYGTRSIERDDCEDCGKI